MPLRFFGIFIWIFKDFGVIGDFYGSWFGVELDQIGFLEFFRDFKWAGMVSGFGWRRGRRSDG